MDQSFKFFKLVRNSQRDVRDMMQVSQWGQISKTTLIGWKGKVNELPMKQLVT